MYISIFVLRFVLLQQQQNLSPFPPNTSSDICTWCKTGTLQSSGRRYTVTFWVTTCRSVENSVVTWRRMASYQCRLYKPRPWQGHACTNWFCSWWHHNIILIGLICAVYKPQIYWVGLEGSTCFLHSHSQLFPSWLPQNNLKVLQGGLSIAWSVHRLLGRLQH